MPVATKYLSPSTYLRPKPRLHNLGPQDLNRLAELIPLHQMEKDMRELILRDNMFS